MGFLLQPYTHGLKASCGTDVVHALDLDPRRVTNTVGEPWSTSHALNEWMQMLKSGGFHRGFVPKFEEYDADGPKLLVRKAAFEPNRDLKQRLVCDKLTK